MRAAYVMVALAALFIAARSCTKTDILTGERLAADCSWKITLAISVLKKGMSHPLFGLPALDPFYLEEQDINLDLDNMATLQGRLSNFNMTELSTFQYSDLACTSDTFMNLKINVSLADLSFTGGYFIQGNLGGGMVNIHGDGLFDVHPGNLWVTADLDLYKNESISIQRLALNYNLGYFHTNITGLYGDEELSSVLSQVVAEFVTTVALKYKPEIISFLNVAIPRIANELLKNISLPIFLEDQQLREDLAEDFRTMVWNMKQPKSE